jgi:hypothetical protein
MKVICLKARKVMKRKRRRPLIRKRRESIVLLNLRVHHLKKIIQKMKARKRQSQKRVRNKSLQLKNQR